MKILKGNLALPAFISISLKNKSPNLKDFRTDKKMENAIKMPAPIKNITNIL